MMIKISVWKRFEQKTCWRCGLADCPPASKFISNKETLERVNCGSHICQDPLVQAIIQSGASGMFAAPKLQQTLCHYAIQVWHCTVSCLLTSLIQHTYQSNGGTWMICYLSVHMYQSPKIYYSIYTYSITCADDIFDDILHTIHGWYGHAACISCSCPLELYIVLPWGRASQPQIRKYSFSSCFCLPLEMWFGCVQKIGSPKFHWFSTEIKHVHVFLGVMF